ncbi:MAG: peptide chain release factor 1 [Candidatus Izemoplasmataceae bacterium]
MKDRLDKILERYNDINKQLIDPEITKDIKKLTALSKEQSALEKTVSTYKDYLKTETTIKELKELSKEDDEDIRELAMMELEEAKEEKHRLEEALKVLLIPKDPNDEKNVIVEVRGAAGGDEANIFAGDLYRMYLKYAESKNWKIELVGLEESDAGGFSQIEFTVSGDNVYSLLKYESGAHRVQRVPQTESQGRIHTSTATVLVLPEAEDVEVEMNMNDLRIDTFRSSGSGGQSVNTTDSAVRVTHLPSGIIVTCQDGKSQHENKATALKVMRARLHDKAMQEKMEKEGEERRSKIGTGDRSEKIRTYNYPQNRITDHRIGFTIQQLDRVMEGKLDPIIDALIEEELKRKLSGENA